MQVAMAMCVQPLSSRVMASDAYCFSLVLPPSVVRAEGLEAKDSDGNGSVASWNSLASVRQTDRSLAMRGNRI